MDIEELKSLKYFLEARHLIVHRGGKIDKKFIKDIGKGQIGDEICFLCKDIKNFKNIIKKLTDSLIKIIKIRQ